MYGSLICAKRFRSDRQNKEGCSQTPGGHQYMIIKYLSVGQWTWFLYQQVALNVLFQMRYDSFPNSNKQPSDSLRAETPPVFITLKPCFAYCLAQWGPPGVCRHPSSFWSLILQFLRGDKSTIPHMKGNILSFNMGYSSLPCPKYLQRHGPGEEPCESPLVSGTFNQRNGRRH